MNFLALPWPFLAFPCLLAEGEVGVREARHGKAWQGMAWHGKASHGKVGGKVGARLRKVGARWGKLG